MQWETVIGLEVHVQLATQSKIFSGAATTFGAEPNTQACALDLALPGTLPVVNAEAIRMAVMFGLGIDAEIGRHSVFDRKNYFYPDLPKGYQISQMDYPIVGPGQVEIHLQDGSRKLIGVTRAHLEEDAGKSLHEDFHGMTGIDLNRAGTPLLEIVSEPDIRSAEEAVAYLKYIHALITYLGISDGNMSEGSMRCDVNLSLRPVGQDEFGTRTEIKNVNSFRFIEKAIHSEIVRQMDILEDGGSITQETRLYDADKNETRPMRSKEVANDYRYFPEPDLLPVELDEQYIDDIRRSMPELPRDKCQRFIDQYKLSDYDASVLTASRAMADFYETAVNQCQDAKLAANWVTVELSAILNREDTDISASPASAEQIGTLVTRIKDNTISGKIAKQVLEVLCDPAQNPDASGEAVDRIIEEKGLRQMTDSSAIEAMVDEVINANPQQVEQYRAADEGKRKKMFGFFVGQVMKASQGKANPGQVNQLLKSRLED